MSAKTVVISSRMERLIGLTNTKSTPIPGTKIKYFVGITSSRSTTNSLETRKATQSEAYAEVAGTYGFSKISSVTAKVGYKNTTSSETKESSSTLSSTEMKNNLELDFDLGEVPAGKGIYVYQPILLDQKVLMNFRDLIVSDEPLTDIDVRLILEGEAYDAVRFCSLECFADTHFTKVLSYYAGASEIYMGDNWVLNDDTNRATARWRLELCTSLGNDNRDVYWIIHNATGKLLTWYPGSDVYAGDVWVKAKSHDEGGASLWRIYPAESVGDGFYIQAFRHAGQLLSWYPDHKVYAGDDWVKNDAKAKLGSVWRLRALS